MEIWKPIPGYEGHYEASNTGHIRSVERIVILKTRDGKNDRPSVFKSTLLKPYIKTYERSNINSRLQVALSVNGKLKTWDVHKLIALTFVENPSDYDTVNHIDGNPMNNHSDNLEWISRADNIRHSFKEGLVKTQRPVAQIDPRNDEIIKIYPGESEACRRIGISQGKIGAAIRRNGTCGGFKWRHIDIDNEGVTTIESWKGFQ